MRDQSGRRSGSEIVIGSRGALSDRGEFSRLPRWFDAGATEEHSRPMLPKPGRFVVLPDAVRYAGFWVRAMSFALDFLPFCLAFLLMRPAILLSPSAAIAVYLLIGIAPAVYRVYYHAQFGQTLGKMAARIMISRVDHQPLRLRDALLRDSVAISLQLVWLAGMVWLLANWSEPDWATLSANDVGRLIELRLPFRGWILTAQAAWFSSEIVVLLSNKERRALHDFMAGTVVTRVRTRLVDNFAAAD